MIRAVDAGAPPRGRESFWRPDRVAAPDVRADLCWLLGLGLVLVATGLGFRDPWPADEPRFALIARDMVRTGQWLFPQVGGDWYADKPPLFFWLIAGVYRLTGSLRIAFLLPSLLATLGTTLAVYDLVRRVWNRAAAFAAGWLLLVTFQFVWQGRQAQIDAVLCLWTTLSLYGLLRHLLAGPHWGWHAAGWGAAGLGVITKGVGFLPLLLLAINGLLRWRGWGSRGALQFRGRQWIWGPLAFLAVFGAWLVPMLLSANTPELVAYRGEILLQQTIGRYAAAWQHRQPFWYFAVEVIPVLWLPLTGLVPWCWPQWRAAFSAKDVRTVLPLLWVLVVVAFFSASPGKRGVYVLPALPALVIAAAPCVPELFERRGPRRVFAAVAWGIPVIAAVAAIYLLAAEDARLDVLAQYGVDARGPLIATVLSTLAVCAVLWRWSAVLAYTGVLATALAVVGFLINPALNSTLSGKRFARSVEEAAAGHQELGLVAYKEQYLLWFTRPTINFGHARWRDADAEAADAAAWLAGAPGRALLVPGAVRDRCFGTAQATPLGNANRIDWYLVWGAADRACSAAGRASAARVYRARSGSQ